MRHIVLRAGTDESGFTFERALKLLGPKVIAYNRSEGWMVVRKVEADAAIVALKHNGIDAALEERI